MAVRPNRIRTRRKHEGLTLRQLADQIGVDESTLSRYERGERAVPDEHKLALATLFEVSVVYLMGWDRRLEQDGEGDNGEERAA